MSVAGGLTSTSTLYENYLDGFHGHHLEPGNLEEKITFRNFHLPSTSSSCRNGLERGARAEIGRRHLSENPLVLLWPSFDWSGHVTSLLCCDISSLKKSISIFIRIQVGQAPSPVPDCVCQVKGWPPPPTPPSPPPRPVELRLIIDKGVPSVYSKIGKRSFSPILWYCSFHVKKMQILLLQLPKRRMTVDAHRGRITKATHHTAHKLAADAIAPQPNFVGMNHPSGPHLSGPNSKFCRKEISPWPVLKCYPDWTGSRLSDWASCPDSCGSKSIVVKRLWPTSRDGCFSPPPTGCCSPFLELWRLVSWFPPMSSFQPLSE